MNKEKSIIGNIFHKNGRALGSMGYFILLMLVFLIGAPEAWMRPNLHQSVFVMLPTLIFLVIPLVFLVASGEIDLSFASTYAVAAYVFAIMVKSGIDPALAIIAGIITGAAIGALVGALIVIFRLSSMLEMTTGLPISSKLAIAEKVVPKSIPIATIMIYGI